MLTFNNKTYAPLYACANMDNGVLDEGGLHILHCHLRTLKAFEV